MTEYFKHVGSYSGAVKINGRWVRVSGLHQIDTTGWKRRQGPPTTACAKAMREQASTPAIVMFPERKKEKAS